MKLPPFGKSKKARPSDTDDSLPKSEGSVEGSGETIAEGSRDGAAASRDAAPAGEAATKASGKTVSKARRAEGSGSRGKNLSSIAIGDAKLAVGLTWTTHQDPMVPLAREARAAAASEEYATNLIVLRDGIYAQYGFGYMEKGHRPGQAAGALCLADSFSGSWIAAFEIAGLIWVVVAREDIILSNGDAVFEDEQEARSFFSSFHDEMGDWDSVIAPPRWEVEGSREVDLERLVSARSGKIARLRKARMLGGIQRHHVVAFGVAVLLAGGAYGFMSWQEEQRRQEDERLLLQLQEQERLEAIRREEARQRVFDLPTISRPMPTEVLAGCLESFGAHSLLVTGWEVRGFACNGSRSEVLLARQNGNIALLRELVDMSGSQASLAVSDSGEQVRMSLPVEGLEPRGEEEQLAYEDLSSLLVQYAQEYDAEFRIGRLDPVEDISSMSDVGMRNQPVEPIIKWYEATWSIETEIMPFTLAEILTNVGGVDIQRLEFDTGGTWRLSGAFYQR